jgi:hypothetical protein
VKGLFQTCSLREKNEGRYNTADATLWFFHALNRYLQYTNDYFTLNSLMDKLKEIIDAHIKEPFLYRCRSCRWFTEAGAVGIAANLDGCKSGGLGSNTQKWKSGRDKCFMVICLEINGKMV